MPGRKINLHSTVSIRALGFSFSGKSYFSRKEADDFLKMTCNKSLAQRFYVAKRQRPFKIVRAIRKAEKAPRFDWESY